MHFNGNRHQRGMSVVALTMILLVLAIVQIGLARRATVHAEETVGRVVGGMLSNIKLGMDEYMKTYSTQLLTGASVSDGTTTVADPLAPTVTELSNMGYLPATTSTVVPAIQGGYNITIARVPAGCGPPPAPTQCNLQSSTWPTNPLRPLGSPRLSIRMLGAAAETIGADGGFSDALTPGTIRGMGAWTRANPAGSVAGIVMAVGGFGSAGYVPNPDLSPYFKRDGSTPLTGNADGGGNSWSNLNNITANNLVTANAYVTPLKTENSACTNANAVAAGSGVVMMCIGGQWKTVSTAVATAGTACTVPGRVATSTANGEQLVCRGTTWVRLVASLPAYREGGRIAVRDGDAVNKPVCDAGGTPAYSFELDQHAVDVTVSPPLQAMYATTQDLGAQWRVIIRLRTNTGTEASANAYNVAAIFKTECYYP